MLSIEESKEISTILDRVKDLDTRADLLSQDDIDALGEHRARLRDVLTRVDAQDVERVLRAIQSSLGIHERYAGLREASAERQENRRSRTVPQHKGSMRIARPPRFAEFMLIALTSPKQADGLLGDFEEKFHSEVIGIGERRARSRYRSRTFGSLLPLFWRWLKKVGVFGLVVSFLKRLSGG